MKKILTLLPVLAIVFAMRGHASAAYDPDTNYAQIMPGPQSAASARESRAHKRAESSLKANPSLRRAAFRNIGASLYVYEAGTENMQMGCTNRLK